MIMKLSASNIGWSKEDDDLIYDLMEKSGFTGLEIAPTRFFPEDPYSHNRDIKDEARRLFETRGLRICSMQSIWYGRSERVFGTDEDRNVLMEYTKRAMDFAAAAGCKNLVFGCPRNRTVPLDMPEDEAKNIAVEFFGSLGEYAVKVGTILSLEANSPVYNTNFINTTPEAVSFVKRVRVPGFKINLDIGTMIENGETVDVITGQDTDSADDVRLINHVHISEPSLKSLSKRDLHREIIEVLSRGGYDGFFSIEVGGQNPLKDLIKNIEYLGNLC